MPTVWPVGYTNLSVSCRWLPASRCLGRSLAAPAQWRARALTTTWRHAHLLYTQHHNLTVSYQSCGTFYLLMIN